MLQSSKKSIFITGAASGIGRAAAKKFASEGWFIGAFDINEQGLSDLAEEFGKENCITGHLDVRTRSDWDRAVTSFCAQTGGRMHVFFNNAGIAEAGPFEEIPEEASATVIDVNLKGVVTGIYACLEALKATPGARIINTASVAGLYGAPNLAVYSATKHAVRGLTEALNIEFERHGISVCDLMPWFIDTAILDFVPKQAGSNQTGKKLLEAQGIKVYPVELAADRAWEAAQGTKIHYTVGTLASRMKFFSYYAPALIRHQLKKSFDPGN